MNVVVVFQNPKREDAAHVDGLFPEYRIVAGARYRSRAIAVAGILACYRLLRVNILFEDGVVSPAVLAQRPTQERHSLVRDWPSVDMFVGKEFALSPYVRARVSESGGGMVGQDRTRFRPRY